MKEIIIEEIPVKGNIDKLIKTLHINQSEDEKRLAILLKEAEKIAKPKGIYQESYIQEIKGNQVRIDDIIFESSLLEVNLEGVYLVFPFIITAGQELGKWAQNIDGLLEQFWANKIQEVFLQEAVTYIFEDMQKKYQIEKMATMNPGSLEEWPISEQKKLFDLIENPDQKIGVELSDSYLMLPSKSLSGIRFPTDLDYVNCKLCSRVRCPDRRAAYDKELHHEKYSAKK